jgi:hypothetical protein
VWKKLLIAILALILLLLPLGIRWLHFYDGRYEPAEVARPDLAAIRAPTLEIESFVDRYAASPAGTILVDLAHDNRFEMADLSTLQARLTARGQRLEAVETTEELEHQLRYAKALIVISPGTDWAPAEIEQVQEFVDKGGRLLLVTDPTRYAVEYDEEDFPILDEDVPHINGLSAQFGFLFQADYLYNTTDSAGNFRNIKLTDFIDHSLTEGLDQVAFYAAHSINTDEPPLISTGGETRSSTSERAEALAVAVLAADGAVLALGDLTFMAEPYNATFDNDRFIANIADFLSGVQRQYQLADFPFFFDPQVDLVYAGAPLLDSDLLQGGSALQTLFADEGKELTVQETENEAIDTLFFGLYQEAEAVEPYLATANVSLLITPTETVDAGQRAYEEAEPEISPTPFPTVTTPLTPTTDVTSALTITVVPPAGVSQQPEITATASISPSVKQRIQIQSVGDMVLTGTLLLLLQTDGERQVMVVLADTEEGLKNAVQRLKEGDLTGCLLRKVEAPPSTVLALCPTGEVLEGDGAGGWQEPEVEPAPPSVSPPVTETIEPITPTVSPTETTSEPGANILVIALDRGEGRYDSMTSAESYATALEGQHDVTVWSQAQDGPLDSLEFPSYDLMIWTAGDFEDAFGTEENELLFSAMVEGMPVIMSGAYIGDAETQAVQRDIQVKDATHPIAKGFQTGEVIGFVAAPSGRDYEVDLMDEETSKDGVIVLVRGPDSEETGEAAAFAFEDAMAGVQVVFIGFPLYLLPEEARVQLVLNTVDWMLGTD